MPAPEQRETELARGDAPEAIPGSVAPGALSALLEELARGPSPRPGDDVRPWPLPGTVIGRFQLLREVGHGGFGVVYEARDAELQRSVAFKLVRPGRLRIGEDQFRREAEIIARFSHPNLVTIFDLGRSDFGPYLVFELLRGQTLQARLEQGPMPPEEAVRVAVEVAKGLAHAHGQAVVHRDLKPSNVFLCDDGRVKLLDFGMSHAFGWRGLEGGTPAYMAPEQWRGAPEDERTDVYALGVVLFRALSGELPFDTEHGGDPVLSDRPAPALEVSGEPALGGLVARMLEKDPTRRPRDANEVLEALTPLQREIERGVPVGVGPVRTVSGRRVRMAGMAALGAALGVLAYGGLRFWREQQASPPGARAIAVLPFENMSGGPENEYLSDGLADEILNLLTRVRELKVAASTSSFRFKGRRVDAAEVADRLKVDVLLVGSVRRDAGRLRIGAELVDAKSGFRLWSQIYDRRFAEVFAVQDDIARQVVNALELVLSRASWRELGRPPTGNIAAYDLYLRGRDFLRRPVTRENLEAATRQFEEAIEKDGAFAQAHAGLCEAWLGRYEREHAAERFEQADKACRAALAEDRDAPEVHVALGKLHLAAGKADDAEREFRKALAGPRPSVDAWIGLAGVFKARRETAGAERAFAEAEQVDAADWRIWQQHGHMLFGLGRYAEAAKQYREVMRITPENASAYSNLGAALYLGGDFEGATAAYRRSLELSPSTIAYSNLGTTLFYSGKLEEAAAAYTRARDLAPEDYQQWGNLGDVYTFAEGKARDAALAYERAVALAEAVLKVNPSDAEVIAELARFHARLGHIPEAGRLIDRALERDPRSVYVNYNAALVAAQRHRVDEAVERIEKAVALGYPRALLSSDEGLAGLRSNERFAALAGARRSR